MQFTFSCFINFFLYNSGRLKALPAMEECIAEKITLSLFMKRDKHGMYFFLKVIWGLFDVPQSLTAYRARKLYDKSASNVTLLLVYTCICHTM